jgi:uncharacterized metal-binding protein
MSSGRVHSTVTILASGAILATFPVAGPLVVPLALGCFSGVFLSPDLDSNGRVNSHDQVRRFGGVAGELFSFAWYLMWLPYASWIPHRDWKSHFPIIGTLIRLAYLMIITAGGLGAVPYLTYYAYLNRLWVWYLWAGLWVYGLVIADWLHFMFDMIKIERGRVVISRPIRLERKEFY